MALRPKGTFDQTATAQQLVFYRTNDGEGGTEVVHVSAQFTDSMGKVYSVGGKLADLTSAAERQALASIRDTMAAMVAEQFFDEV